jgi:hypothetical protein
MKDVKTATKSQPTFGVDSERPSLRTRLLLLLFLSTMALGALLHQTSDVNASNPESASTVSAVAR